MTQEVLANTARTFTLERTFRPFHTATATVTKTRRRQNKSILEKLGIILQFACLLFICTAILATMFNERETTLGIYLCAMFMLLTGLILNSYGKKS
ncbi:MAG: hypothetical protein L0H53_03880 [Candidatus Nitrosocosmicus sp.]|nr:hypothetical protein [Candidatus Nitrosocosmicus sp.]MDN5866353.1 hypothetical protein [Candidatus Nitrosocosmicus sp.]